MITNKLPSPINIVINENMTFKDVINDVYQEYFKIEFMDKDKRKRLFGKFIYLDLDFIDYKPERFWHMISFIPSEEKYTVDPCVNSDDLLICKSLKKYCYKEAFMPEHIKLDDRCECIYRIRRTNWINPILELANNKDNCIKYWTEDDVDRKNNKIRKAFIRFQDGLADYLIVLIDNEINNKRGYKFITAYPVVHNGTRKRLDKSYEQYKNTQQK